MACKFCSVGPNSVLIQGGLAVLLCAIRVPALAQAPHTAVASDAPTQALQRKVDSLRERLKIVAPVVVSLVEVDERTLSVRRSPAAADGFTLAAERRFITALSDEQLEAALAHELGHVWIYTHHPYLQTEQLANRVAMRVVSRDRLVDVYRALWGADAMHGSLEAFLGIE